jgi:hypothetical protein
MTESRKGCEVDSTRLAATQQPATDERHQVIRRKKQAGAHKCYARSVRDPVDGREQRCPGRCMHQAHAFNSTVRCAFCEAWVCENVLDDLDAAADLLRGNPTSSVVLRI